MQKEQTPFRNIKLWSPDDRPREKLQQKGRSSLSDAELIAILLGTGTATVSAVDLAKTLLSRAGNDLHHLARMAVSDLTKVKGIGPAKAVTLVAALELGRRRKDYDETDRTKIASSRDVYQLLKPDLTDLNHEAFWILLLNRANKVIGKHQISQGGIAGTVADPKIIFKLALDALASGIILAHNHPSGNLTASQADIDLTRKIKDGAKLLDMQVLDHLILAGKNYFSFADEGML